MAGVCAIKRYEPQLAIRKAANLVLNYGPLSVVVLISSWHYGHDHFYFQWAVGLSLLSAFIIARLSCSWLIIPFAYFLFRASPHFAGLDAYRVHLNHAHYMASVGGFALFQFIALVLIPIFYLVLKDPEIERMRNIFLGSAVLNALYVLFGVVIGPANSGFSDYSGINGCLMATQVPLALDNPKWRFAVPVLCFGALASGASIPLGVLGVALVSFALFKYGRSGFRVSILGIAFAALLLNQIQDTKPFDDAKRFEAYRLFMTDWAQQDKPLLGIGPGTFTPSGSVIQATHDFFTMGNKIWLFANMHSDWLQVIWEYGIVGLSFALFLAGSLLFKLCKNKDPAISSALLSFMACATLNGPIRYFPLSLYLGFLCIAALRGKSNCYTDGAVI